MGGIAEAGEVSRLRDEEAPAILRRHLAGDVRLAGTHGFPVGLVIDGRLSIALPRQRRVIFAGSAGANVRETLLQAEDFGIKLRESEIENGGQLFGADFIERARQSAEIQVNEVVEQLALALVREGVCQCAGDRRLVGRERDHAED